MTDVDEHTDAHHQNGTGRRVPPQDLDAEISLLAATLMSRHAIDAATDRGLDARDFARPAHGHIYAAATHLHEHGEPVDTVTVAAELGRRNLLDTIGGHNTLTDIQARISSTSSAGHYAGIVIDHARLRRLIAAAAEIEQIGYSHPDDVTAAIEHAERLVIDLLAGDRGSDRARLIHDALDDHLALLEARWEGTVHEGAPTGLADLDKLIGGLRPGQLITIAGRPGTGKTALGLNIAANAAAHGHATLFSSIEMGETELLDRLVSAHSRTRHELIRAGRLAENDWPRVSHAIGRLAELPLTIQDSPAATIARIHNRARRIPGLAVVVVDYLQIIDPGAKGESRRVDVDELARGLKRLARTLGVAVVALAQLNRSVEQRADKRPMLSDLRESGQIEQESDVVIGLYRDELYNPTTTKDAGVLEAIVLKYRQGATGTARLGYLTATQQIVDLAKEM